MNKLLKTHKTCIITAVCLFSFVLTSITNVAFAVNDLPNKNLSQAVNLKGKYDLDGLKSHLESSKYKKDGLIDLQQDFNAFPSTAKMNLTLSDIDVPTALKIIAKEGGKNIIVDPSVVGYLNTELKNISLNEAMKIILVSNELEARVDGNTIFVASRPVMSKKGLNRKYIKAFKLNNSNAVDVAHILEASVFNKGYKVNEDAAGGTALASTDTKGQDSQTTSSNQTASSSGQSSLVDGKKLTGKVEEVVAGSGFGDASKLASAISIQSTKTSSKEITVNNNDGGAIVIPDTRSNSVLVAGLKDDISLAQAAIEYLDKPLKQVSIEVSLIELNKEDSDNLGFLIDGGSGHFNSAFNSAAMDSFFKLPAHANQDLLVFSSDKIISDGLYVRLNALLQNQKAKLLANPTVVALDNSESLIKITDQVVNKIDVMQDVNLNKTFSVTLADVGIVLNILPKIGDDGTVTMKIRPSITTALEEKAIGTLGGFVTPISTREVIIQDVRVKSGETLALAGLLKDSKVETSGKVPFFGDIPLIGVAFKNKVSTTQKTELVILITPKIINDSAL